MRGGIALGLGVALAGCVERRGLELEPGPGLATVVVSLDDSDELLWFRPPGPTLPSAVAERLEAPALWLLYPEPPEWLDLTSPPGEFFLSRAELPAHVLPTPAEARLTADGDEFRAVSSTTSVRARLLVRPVPSTAVGACLEAGGCFEAGRCVRPCPAPPPPAPPTRFACPDDSAPCEGWPSCAPGELVVPGVRGCRPRFDAAGCDADLAGRRVVHASPGAVGGDGSPGAPVGSIDRALLLAGPGGVVRLAPGTYAEAFESRREAELRGPCELSTPARVVPTGGRRCVEQSNELEPICALADLTLSRVVVVLPDRGPLHLAPGVRLRLVGAELRGDVRGPGAGARGVEVLRSRVVGELDLPEDSQVTLVESEFRGELFMNRAEVSIVRSRIVAAPVLSFGAGSTVELDRVELTRAATSTEERGCLSVFDATVRAAGVHFTGCSTAVLGGGDLVLEDLEVSGGEAGLLFHGGRLEVARAVFREAGLTIGIMGGFRAGTGLAATLAAVRLVDVDVVGGARGLSVHPFGGSNGAWVTRPVRLRAERLRVVDAELGLALSSYGLLERRALWDLAVVDAELTARAIGVDAPELDREELRSLLERVAIRGARFDVRDASGGLGGGG